MAIRVVRYPNPTGTAGEAPFLGRVIVNGFCSVSDFSGEVAKTIHVDEAFVRTVLNQALVVLANDLKQGSKVHFGELALFNAKIDGCAKFIDAPFNHGSATEGQDLQTSFLNGVALDHAFDGVEVKMVAGEEIADLSVIHSVRDYTRDEKGVIHGTEKFEMLGRNITADGEAEVIALCDAEGEVLSEAEEDSSERGQRIIAHLKNLPPVSKKNCSIVLKTHGTSGGEILYTLKSKVDYVYAEPPTPPAPTLTKVHPSDEPDNDGWMKPNPYENTVEGTNLAAATKLEFKYVDGEDEYVDEFEIVSKTADSIVFKANASTLTDIGGHLIVTTPAGTCEGDFMATVMGS